MEQDFYYHSSLNRDRLVHIVDPDTSACEALSVLFRLEGFQTVSSLDGKGFISSCEYRNPDVVVLSISADEGQGLSLLRHV